MRAIVIYVTAAATLVAVTAFGFVPSQVKYQGRLNNSAGVPLTDTVSLTFTIYNNSAGSGIAEWTETHPSVPVIDGLFAVTLGTFNPLEEGVFNVNTVIDRYLAISVDGGPKLEPLQKVLAVPYALRVATVDDATGGVIDGKLTVGLSNTNTADNSFVVGDANSVSGQSSSVTGGRFGSASGSFSHIGGGSQNVASGRYSTIGGGDDNLADTIGATVGGGQDNIASQSNAVVAGGSSNTASGDRGAILGGNGNTASGEFSTSVAGFDNEAQGYLSAVVGGRKNFARGDFSFVGGGGADFGSDLDSNSALGEYSAIVGGQRNLASGYGTTVVGGTVNSAEGSFSFVGGGNANSTQSFGSFLGGGSVNSIDAAAVHSSIVGGYDHTISGGDLAFIGGGALNQITNTYGTIAGGLSNIVTGIRGSIGGGRGNRARGSNATIAGGGNFLSPSDSNVATGNSSTIGGGGSHIAGGDFSTIPGGFDNSSAGKYSFAAGRGASAAHAGSFVWGDSTNAIFASTGINQFLIRASGGVGIGTNSPDAPLHVQDGSAGAVSGNSSAAAVFERNGECWLHILSPDATQRGILFGSPGNSIIGSIRFNPSGTEKGYHFRCGNNNIRLVLDSLGNLTADGCVVGSNIACPSDARLKENVATLTNALSQVEQLRGVQYEWRQDISVEREFPKGKQIGLIAQEVMKIVPQAVIEGKDGYYAVDYSRLVPLLIQGMKEQQSQIEEQGKQISELRRLLEQLVQ